VTHDYKRHASSTSKAANRVVVPLEWLCRHPRWTFHFTPTSASWLNAVEGFFAILTKRRLKRGVFKGVVDLQAAINRFVVTSSQSPSSGPPILTKSSPPLRAVTKC
jgi:transposase